MSYFWAKHNRQDNSDHNQILTYLNDKGIDIYPPQFEKIADSINNKLMKQDYYSYKRGSYRKPVETQDVISAIEEYKTDEDFKKQSRPRALSSLDSLTDEVYIAKIQEKHNANK